MNDKNQKNTRKNLPLQTTPSNEDVAIEKILDELNIPQDSKDKIIHSFSTTIKSVQSSYVGPIPPPQMLNEYNSIITNGADRIISLTEKQMSHRQDLEIIKENNKFKISIRGQWFGFATSILFLGSSIYLAMNGHEGTASVLAGTTLAVVVSAFIAGKSWGKKRSSIAKQ